jgi:hypothetical protein
MATKVAIPAKARARPEEVTVIGCAPRGDR